VKKEVVPLWVSQAIGGMTVIIIVALSFIVYKCYEIKYGTFEILTIPEEKKPATIPKQNEATM
jgi:hypothetical protein